MKSFTTIIRASIVLSFLASEVVGTAFSTPGVPCYLHPAGDGCHYRLKPDSDVCTTPFERKRISRGILLVNRTLLSLEHQLIRLGIISSDNTCSKLPTVDNGGLIYSNLNLSPGTSGRYICNEGYTLQLLNGRVKFTCNEDGLWDGDVKQVPVRCHLTLERCEPPEDITNGTISFINNDTANVFIGDVITYTCEPGSELQGPQERFCLRSGNWSGYKPLCNKISADENPNEVDQTPAIGTGNDVKIGASVGSAVAVLAIMFVTVVAVLVLYKSYLKRKSCTPPSHLQVDDTNVFSTAYVSINSPMKTEPAYRSTQHTFDKDEAESII